MEICQVNFLEVDWHIAPSHWSVEVVVVAADSLGMVSSQEETLHRRGCIQMIRNLLHLLAPFLTNVSATRFQQVLVRW